MHLVTDKVNLHILVLTKNGGDNRGNYAVCVALTKMSVSGGGTVSKK